MGKGSQSETSQTGGSWGWTFKEEQDLPGRQWQLGLALGVFLPQGAVCASFKGGRSQQTETGRWAGAGSYLAFPALLGAAGDGRSRRQRPLWCLCARLVGCPLGLGQGTVVQGPTCTDPGGVTSAFKPGKETPNMFKFVMILAVSSPQATGLSWEPLGWPGQAGPW